jgi:hypothetical protein
MADLRAVARAKAKKYGLDPGVFERQIQQESGFNPKIRSPAGALGIAQIMPATARGWGVNPLNPSQALDAAARNMARYVQQFGSYEKALRAYNAGPGNVERSKSFAETNNYVRKILGGSSGGAAPRLLTTKRTVPGALIAGAAGMSLTTPGISFDAKGYDEARRKSILGEMIAKRNPNSILLRSGLLTTTEPSTSDFTKETSSTTKIAGLGSYRIPSSTSTSTRLVGGGGARGPFKIVGPNPGRVKPYVSSFMRRVAGVYGQPITASDGSTHSKYTVNGTISEHYTGQAVDNPASGAALTRMGQAALVAAGWSPARARKVKGGLFNVMQPDGTRIQIIFNTMEGGNHYNHLHVGIRPG